MLKISCDNPPAVAKGGEKSSSFAQDLEVGSCWPNAEDSAKVDTHTHTYQWPSETSKAGGRSGGRTSTSPRRDLASTASPPEAGRRAPPGKSWRHGGSPSGCFSMPLRLNRITVEQPSLLQALEMDPVSVASEEPDQSFSLFPTGNVRCENKRAINCEIPACIKGSLEANHQIQHHRLRNSEGRLRPMGQGTNRRACKFEIMEPHAVLPIAQTCTKRFWRCYCNDIPLHRGFFNCRLEDLLGSHDTFIWSTIMLSGSKRSGSSVFGVAETLTDCSDNATDGEESANLLRTWC